MRDRFNANEILVSLMLVYVAVQVLGYLVYGPWKDPLGYNFPQTKTFEAATRIPRLISGLAHERSAWCLAVAGGGWYLGVSVSHHVPVCPAGGGLGAGGCALCRVSHRAKRCGPPLLVSGGMRRAWLAGWRWQGPLRQLTPYVPAGYGFAAIIVAFVGRLHPVGMVFSALLMSMFYIGGELAQSRLGLPQVA